MGASFFVPFRVWIGLCHHLFQRWAMVQPESIHPSVAATRRRKASVWLGSHAASAPPALVAATNPCSRLEMKKITAQVHPGGTGLFEEARRVALRMW
jgi:hypothetical protein